MTPDQKFVVAGFLISFIGATYLTAILIIWDQRPKWRKHVMRELDL